MHRCIVRAVFDGAVLFVPWCIVCDVLLVCVCVRVSIFLHGHQTQLFWLGCGGRHWLSCLSGPFAGGNVCPTGDMDGMCILPTYCGDFTYNAWTTHSVWVQASGTAMLGRP